MASSKEILLRDEYLQSRGIDKKAQAVTPSLPQKVAPKKVQQPV